MKQYILLICLIVLTACQQPKSTSVQIVEQLPKEVQNYIESNEIDLQNSVQLYRSGKNMYYITFHKKDISLEKPTYTDTRKELTLQLIEQATQRNTVIYLQVDASTAYEAVQLTINGQPTAFDLYVNELKE